MSIFSKSFQLFCLLFSGCLFAGGAWVKEQNKFYSELGYSYYQAKKIFNPAGRKLNNFLVPSPLVPISFFAGEFDSTYTQQDLNLYIEYGIGWDLELSLNLPYSFAKQDAPGLGEFSVSGIADGRFGIKYKWLDLPKLFVSAVQVEVGLPIGDEDQQALSGNNPAQPVPLGDGEWDTAIRLFFSRSFYPIPIYFNGDVGYRFRTGSFFDDL